MHTPFQGCRQRAGDWLQSRNSLFPQMVPDQRATGTEPRYGLWGIHYTGGLVPAGRQVGSWPRSLPPPAPVGGDRLLPLRTRILGKPYSGRNKDVEKGSGRLKREWEQGDGACLRICLGSNKIGVSLGYSSSSSEEPQPQ